MIFAVYRCLMSVALLMLPIVNQVPPPRAAEETFPVVTTTFRNLVAHPVSVIAAPLQTKKVARIINLPISSLRKTEAPPVTANGDVTFAMNAAQALRIGNALVIDGAHAEALSYFQDAHKQQPNLFEALLALAECYYQVRRDDEAIATYKEVIGQNPAIWEAHFHLGRIYLEHARFAEASAAFTEALKIKPGDADTMSGLGIALVKQGNSAAAIPYLTQVTALQRFNSADALYSLGEAYANESQWLQAAAAFKAGADIRGLSPDAYFNWATMLYNADQLNEAVEAYRKVKQVDLNHRESAFYIADSLKRLGKPVEALGYYAAALQYRPDDTEVLRNVAYIYFEQGQWGDAELIWKKLTVLDPKNADAFTNLAAYQSRDNEKFALANMPTQGITLREVVRANPSHAEAHINLGSQLITERIYPEAVEILQSAVRLMPNSAAANFNLGLAQLKAGQFENAVASNLKALQIKSEWSDAYNNLGLAYAGLMKWDDAAKAYLEAIRLNPKYAGARYNLGMSYVQLRQKALALEQVESLKPLSVDLPRELGYKIRDMERATTVIVAATSPSPSADVPTPPSTPVIETEGVPAAIVEPKGAESDKSAAAEGCPGPIYRSTDVTQMAQITSTLEASYTDDARKYKEQGKVVLQAVLCANGRVSDITVKEGLLFGLTEQAIEAMKKVHFQPAMIEGKRVSVMVNQEFVCAVPNCTARIQP